MKRFLYTDLVCLLIVGLAALNGCTQSTPPSAGDSAEQGAGHAHDPDHHDHQHDHDSNGKHVHDGERELGKHPQSYAEAVNKLDRLRTAIRDAFAADDTERADQSVHELGHLLEEIPSLADREAFTAAEQESIKQAVDVLFECFGDIDEKLHGQQGKAYSEVAPRIDEVTAALLAIAKSQEK